MASLSRDGNGTSRIQFVWGDERRAIRLGKVSTRFADEVLRRVEQLVAHAIQGTGHKDDLSSWIASLPPVIHERFVKAGLVAPRMKAAAPILDEVIEEFLRLAVAKPATIKIYQQTASSLRIFFGGETILAAITYQRALEWRRWLSEPHPILVGRARRRVVRPLAHATQAKRLEVARQIFKEATRWGMIAENPFDGVKGGSKENAARMFYVSREATAAILERCSTPDWRAIVGLCRYAGLRCPSELIGLRWADVDWNRNLLHVRSVKTEHHGAAHAERHVPIGDELREILEGCFSVAEDRRAGIVPSVTDGTANLRTEFSRIVARTGLEVWPRLFQNLRSSCETDWLTRYPGRIKAIASWMGHSPAIAMKHYAQILPEHVDGATAAAVGEPGKCAALQSGALILGKAAQNPAQQPAAKGRNRPQARKPETCISRENEGSPRNTKAGKSQRVGATRFERATSTSRT